MIRSAGACELSARCCLSVTDDVLSPGIWISCRLQIKARARLEQLQTGDENHSSVLLFVYWKYVSSIQAGGRDQRGVARTKMIQFIIGTPVNQTVKNKLQYKKKWVVQFNSEL
uniref:Uncharacterized protein n=1 Tax=Triticum urartu TaxID=4572 RepID=A0A8R7UFM1_TRIUA